MILALLLLAATLYGWGLVRVARARRPFPGGAAIAYSLGLAVVSGFAGAAARRISPTRPSRGTWCSICC